MEPSATSSEASRRSTRIRAQIPLRITSADPAVNFSEQCYTLVVNTQGCGVRLGRAAEVGLPVEIETITGHKFPARVANCVSLGSDGKYWLVGFALDEPGNVWGINPAPDDWGQPKAMAVAASSVAASSGPANPSKKGEWPYAQFSQRGEFHPGRK
jgi:hypothetical protein